MIPSIVTSHLLLFMHSFIHSFIGWLKLGGFWFIHVFIHYSFIRPFIPPFSHSSISLLSLLAFLINVALPSLDALIQLVLYPSGDAGPSSDMIRTGGGGADDRSAISAQRPLTALLATTRWDSGA